MAAQERKKQDLCLRGSAERGREEGQSPGGRYRGKKEGTEYGSRRRQTGRKMPGPFRLAG